VNISETDEDIQNRSNILSTAILPALGETSPVNFGPVTLEILGHVTLLPGEFHSSKFLPIGLRAPGGLALGFAPNF